MGLVVFWSGLVPVGGAFFSRHSWRLFRRRFNSLLLKPFLDYGTCQRVQEAEPVFRFSGGFESLTGAHTLWLQSEDLSIPVDLEGAHIYLIPSVESPGEAPFKGDFSGFFEPGEEAPERIRWNRLSSLTTGTKVFVGGALALRDRRRIFVATRETPLMVIFYEGPDRSFSARAIQAGRHRNEYWNTLTPYSLILGAFSQLMMALAFLPRPAFRLTALTAFIALFIPLLPLIPPGLLFTILYRHLWERARLFRACRDLARLPLNYLPPEEKLAGGESYGAIQVEALPPAFFEQRIPFIIPGSLRPPFRGKEGWYVFGAVDGEGLPREPQDPFAIYGALPGSPEVLARSYSLQALILELLSWLILLAGLGLNLFFIQMIVSLLF